MKSIVFVALFALIVNICLAVHNIGCNVNEERHYAYKSLIHSFGGSVRDESGRHDNANSKKGEKSEISADVYFTCAKQWVKRTATNSTQMYLMHMNIKNVKMNMEMDDPKLMKMKTVKGAKPYDYNKHFAKFTAFTMASNGKIYKVFHEKQEESWVTAMKKSIIAQLQVKFGDNAERVEKDGVGKHTAHYNQTRLADGSRIVRKQFTDKDVQTSNMSKKKQMRLNSNTDTLVDSNGQIKATVKHDAVVLGTHHHKPHQAVFDERNIPYSDDSSFSTGKSMWLNADEVTSLTFVKTQRFNSNISKMVRHKRENKLTTPQSDQQEEIMFDSHADLVLDSSIVQSDLSVSEDVLAELGLQIQRNFFIGRVNATRLINKLARKPDHATVAAKLSQYVALDDSALDALNEKFHLVFNKLKKQQQEENSQEAAAAAKMTPLVYEKKQKLAEKREDFLRAAQAIFASAGSSKAQKHLINSLKTKPLINHGIMRSINVKKPSADLIQVLSHYSSFISTTIEQEALSDTEDATSASDEIIAMNAFLALADMSSRLHANHSRPIIDKIIENLQETRSMKHFLLNVHALGNAGNKAPLSVLKMLLLKRRIPERVKLAAADALRKRTSKKEDEEINKLVHRIVSSKRITTPVKIATVKAQADREYLIGKGKSLVHFKETMLKKRVPRVLKAAMIPYFVNSDSEIAGEFLSEIKRAWAVEQESLSDSKETEEDHYIEYEEMSEAEFFKKIKKAVQKAAKSVGNAVKKATKKVGEGVKKATKKIGEGVKKATKKVGEAAKKVGKKVATVAKKVGEGVKKVGKAIGNAAKGAVNAVKNVVNEAKKIFGAASFEGNKICVPASRKPSDEMCFYDKNMLNFLARFGDMSNHNYASHFEFEKLIGSKKIHLYIGALGYAGTNFNCNDPPQTLEFVIAGRFEAKANVFSKTYNVIEASIHSALKGSYDDNMFLKVMGTTLVDARILNEKQVRNLCLEKSKPLANKDFNNLPKYDFQIMIGPIPLVFGFRVTANARLDALAGYCVNDLTAKAGLIPSVSVGVAGHASIGLIIAKAGIELEIALNYALFPNINLQGLKCAVCATLESRVQPMKVKISAFAEIDVWVLKGKKAFKIFDWGAPASNSKLFEKCLNLPRLFNKKNNARVMSENTALLAADQ